MRRGYNINKVPAGGTTGQHLAKRSGSDFDLEWVTVAAASNPIVGTLSAVNPTDTSFTITLSEAIPLYQNFSVFISIQTASSTPSVLKMKVNNSAITKYRSFWHGFDKTGAVVSADYTTGAAFGTLLPMGTTVGDDMVTAQLHCSALDEFKYSGEMSSCSYGGVYKSLRLAGGLEYYIGPITSLTFYHDNAASFISKMRVNVVKHS